MDLTLFITKTGETNPQARGAGKVLLAFALGSTTDLFGDIPYSEAFSTIKGSCRTIGLILGHNRAPSWLSSAKKNVNVLFIPAADFIKNLSRK